MTKALRINDDNMFNKKNIIKYLKTSSRGLGKRIKEREKYGYGKEDPYNNYLYGLRYAYDSMFYVVKNMEEPYKREVRIVKGLRQHLDDAKTRAHGNYRALRGPHNE